MITEGCSFLKNETWLETQPRPVGHARLGSGCVDGGEVRAQCVSVCGDEEVGIN